jgi:uncharacterized CHY-type Zn-finger protein
MEFSARCPFCQQEQKAELQFPLEALPHCSSCKKTLFPHPTHNFQKEAFLDQCPVCGSAHVFKRKDFNQKLGIALIVVGVVLAYFTYGLSLLVVTLIDFFLFKRIKEVGICYQCEAEFRNHPMITNLPTFDLELHDYYRNLKKDNSL